MAVLVGVVQVLLPQLLLRLPLSAHTRKRFYQVLGMILGVLMSSTDLLFCKTLIFITILHFIALAKLTKKISMLKINLQLSN